MKLKANLGLFIFFFAWVIRKNIPYFESMNRFVFFTTCLLFGMIIYSHESSDGEVKKLPGYITAYFNYDKNDTFRVAKDSMYASDSTLVHVMNLENDSTHLFFRLLYPMNRKHVPVIFYQHWGEGDETEFFQEALQLSHEGYASVLMRAPWLKPDCPNPSFMRNGFNLYREGTLDWVKTYDYLFARFPFMDSTKTFFVGHSYGAQIAGMMAGLKPGLKGIVFMAGTVSTTRSIVESDDTTIGTWRKTKTVQYEDWLTKMKPFDSENYLSFYHGNILLQYARKDEFKIDSSQAMEIKKASNAKDVTFRYYDCMHDLSLPEVKADRIVWIREHSK